MSEILVPREPTSDKQFLTHFVALLFVEDIKSIYGNDGVDLLKTFNNAKLQNLHDSAIKEYDYPVANFVTKSIKRCYGGSRLFGLSSVEKNNYITDLRKTIQGYE